MLSWFVSGVSSIAPEVLKMLVFCLIPRLLGFCGVAYSSLFGVWKI